MQAHNRFNPGRESLKISVIYVVLGTFWILLSDKVLVGLVNDKETLSLIGMLKGWIFVFATGALLYGLIYSTFHQLKEYQNRLHQNAYHDSLTGMPNRLALYEDVTRHLTASQKERFALLFLDLDNFKYINDCLGHYYGDKLILEFGGRLAALPSDDLRIYRLSGDEFVIWLNPYIDDAQLEKLAGEIMGCVQQPFDLNGSNVYTTVSVGGSFYPEHGNNVDQLLRSSDIAMYQAKLAGGNTYVRFQPAMNNDFVNRMNIEKHLRSALENNEFVLFYQPQFDAGQENIIGFEALLRWNNPELGLVTPDRFIPIAEDTHLIIPIGEWVLETACDFVNRLRMLTGRTYSISVNLSTLQLMQDNFVGMVEGTIARTGLPPEALELEITESIFMESLQIVNRRVTYLRSKGIRIALDDFGKGYSSLNCLMNLPITTLKIDKSFIDSICSDNKYLTITEHIVNIGRTLGLDVIAEGVETDEQMRYLAAHNCHIIQGYLFSRPLPETEVVNLLLESPARTIRTGAG